MNITEIIPDDFPEWAKEAMDNGQLFNVMCAKAKELDDANKQIEILKSKNAVFPLSHEGCDAFWKYWEENGETNKHGYYESTWGAIGAYLAKAEETEDQRASQPNNGEIS